MSPSPHHHSMYLGGIQPSWRHPYTQQQTKAGINMYEHEHKKNTIN